MKDLKVRATSVDVSVMGSKLSHPLRRNARTGFRSDPDPSRPNGIPDDERHGFGQGLRKGFVSILVSIACLGTACSETRSDGNARAESEPNSPQTGAAVARVDEPFRWPDAVDQPRIGIEVTLPDREGSIEVQLLPELAPESVERILALVVDGYYDGTTFHRVIPGFMIQGGDPNSRDRDPTNDGRGGAQVHIPDEFSAAPFERGVVALANRGNSGTTGPQFFIVHAEHRELDGKYNAIGRVVAGIDLVDAIAGVETDTVGRWGPRDRPLHPVVIDRIRISGPGASPSASNDAAEPSASSGIGEPGLSTHP